MSEPKVLTPEKVAEIRCICETDIDAGWKRSPSWSSCMMLDCVTAIEAAWEAGAQLRDALIEKQKDYEQAQMFREQDFQNLQRSFEKLDEARQRIAELEAENAKFQQALDELGY